MKNANLQEEPTFLLIRHSRKAFVTVQLCLILSSVLFLVATFADLSFAAASRPYAQEIIDMAGRSVLSEYDRDVKDRYGLFLFQLEKEEIQELTGDYIGQSLKKKRGKTNLLSMEVEKAVVDITDYSALDCDILMEQILGLMKYEIFTGTDSIWELLGSSGNDTAELEKTDHPLRKLRNSRVLQELPSVLLKGIDGGTASGLSLPTPNKLGRMAYEEVCLNKYIMNHFGHRLSNNEESFFAGEVEYILCGHYSDESNSHTMYLSLLALRTALNAMHIRQDRVKMEMVQAAALLIGEGVATPAIEAGLIALWAGAEGALDVKNLEDGKRVPFLKTSKQWILSLENAMSPDDANVITENGADDEGLEYKDYLFLFLSLKSRNSKLVRIMDLIHINIKGYDNREFSYASCSTGFDYSIKMRRSRPFLSVLSMKHGDFNGSHKY